MGHGQGEVAALAHHPALLRLTALNFLDNLHTIFSSIIYPNNTPSKRSEEENESNLQYRDESSWLDGEDLLCKSYPQLQGMLT